MSETPPTYIPCAPQRLIQYNKDGNLLAVVSTLLTVLPQRLIQYNKDGNIRRRGESVVADGPQRLIQYNKDGNFFMRIYINMSLYASALNPIQQGLKHCRYRIVYGTNMKPQRLIQYNKDGNVSRLNG